MEFVAVDLGSSFIKAAVVNVQTGKIRDVRKQPIPARLSGLQPDEFEICPNKILVVVRDLLQQLLLTSPNCAGILLTGQMGGLILCGPDKRPVTNYISWQDRRTARQDSSGQSFFQRLSQQLGDQVTSELGNEFRPGLTLPLLCYVKQKGQLSGHENLTPLTLPDFVAASLSDGSPVIERTNLTGLNSVCEPGYAKSLFVELGVDDFAWAETVDYRHRVGNYICASGAANSVPVYAATGDHQCSLVGAGLRDSDLSVNIATGSQISMLTTQPKCGDYQLRPFFDNMWLKTITNIPAGRSLSAIMTLLTEITGESLTEQHWQRFFDAAESIDSTDVDVNLAFFPGAVCGPGHFGNLTESNLSLRHVARACLERMALQYKQLAGRLSGVPWKQIVFSGGLAQKSPLLRRLVSEAIDSSSRLCGANQDSLAGLMILGRVIAGIDESVMCSIARETGRSISLDDR